PVTRRGCGAADAAWGRRRRFLRGRRPLHIRLGRGRSRAGRPNRRPRVRRSGHGEQRRVSRSQRRTDRRTRTESARGGSPPRPLCGAVRGPGYDGGATENSGVYLGRNDAPTDARGPNRPEWAALTGRYVGTFVGAPI